MNVIAAPMSAQNAVRWLGRNPGGGVAPRQWVWLSRGLVALCQWRLEHILHHSDPLDLPLEKFLKEQIAAEEESADSLKRLDWSLPRSDDAQFCSTECDQLLSRLLPSAFIRCGEGLMDREAALHFVEILESDRHRFFSRIFEAKLAGLSEARLKAESDRSSDRLRLVRTILLPPAQSSGPVPIPPVAEYRCAGAIDRRSWVVAVCGEINRLRELQRTSPTQGTEAAISRPLVDLWRPVVIDLMRDMAGAAGDAEGSDEPLAERFIREFSGLRSRGTRDLEDILGVARVALAWLMCGHLRRSPHQPAGAQTIHATA